MYSIFTYIWVIYGVNVGKYSIHGAYGIVLRMIFPKHHHHSSDSSGDLDLPPRPPLEKPACHRAACVAAAVMRPARTPRVRQSQALAPSLATHGAMGPMVVFWGIHPS